MLRRIGIIVAGLAALVAIAALLVVWLVDADDYREQIAQRAGDRLGREVVLDGPIDLRLVPWLAFEIRDVRVANPPDFEPAPPLAVIGRATASVRLWSLFAGEPEIGALSLADARLNRVIDSGGRSNLDGLFDVDPGPTDLSGLTTGDIHLDNVELSLVDLAAGERQVFDIDEFRLAGFRAGQALPFELDAALGDGEQALLDALAVSGRLTVAADLSSLDLTDVAAGFVLPDEAGRGDFRGAANIALTGETPRITVPGLSGVINHSGQTLKLDATEPARIDLGDEVVVALDGLAMHVNDRPVTVTRARARLAGGVMSVDPLAARLFDGRFDGRARIDFTARPVAVEFSPRLEDIQVRELLGLVSASAPAEGLGDVSLAVSFRGLDAAGILSTLNGDGDYAITDGALIGVDLHKLIEQELTTESLANIDQVIGGRTEFDRLAGRVQVADGVLELPDLQLAAAGYGASGRGQLNLAAGELDYRLQLDLGAEFASRLPRRLREASGGRIPLTVRGPVTAPRVQVDLADIAERALYQELGRRLFGDGDDEPTDGDG